MKCIASGCKCNSSVLLATFWGKNEIIGFCLKHQPTWSKDKPVGSKSPSFAGKSFYEIKEVL